MAVSPGEQAQFDFSHEGDEKGYRSWQAQQRRALQELARQLGLPLQRRVEVWLRGEIRLLGVLRLRENQLFVERGHQPRLELSVDNVVFTPAEIISCVAMD